MRVTFEVWRQENDDPKIHLRLLDVPMNDRDFIVDPRAHYSGGNPRLYKTLDALLREQALS